MGNIETYGIGAVCIALIGLIYKVWTDSTKRGDRVLEVLEKVAVSQEKQAESNRQLATNIAANTELTKTSIAATKETADIAKETGTQVKAHADVMTRMVVKILKDSKKKSNS